MFYSTRFGMIFTVVLVVHVVIAGGIYAGYKLHGRQAAAPADSPPEEVVEPPAAGGQVAPVVEASPTVYAVQPGDTYWEIAQKHGISVQQLKEYNGHGANRLLRAHETLRIPPRR